MLPTRSLTGRPSVILPIQYLRGVAALMVVWHHARNQFPSIELLFPSAFGTSGVDLFFVISGFIMVVTTNNANVGPLQFLKRRVIRVVPLYWLLTLVMVGVAWVAPSLFKTLKVSPLTLVESLLFVPHFSQSFPQNIWPLLVPGWTLNFEMFFYLIFAISLALPQRARLAAMVSFFALLTGLGFAFGPFQSPLAQTYSHPMLLEFVAGALIGRAWIGGLLRLPFFASLSLIAAGAVMLVLRDREPLGPFVEMIGATAVVIGALDPRIGAWRSRVLQAIGDSSYSLYLTHLFTLGALRVVWVKLVPDVATMPHAVAFLLLALLGCAAVGWLAWRWIELPLLRLFDGRSARPSNPKFATG